MKKELNLETFNDILFGAMKPDTKKSDLLAKELELAYGIKVQAMEKLVDALNSNKDYANILKKVNTIDDNCGVLGDMLEKAEAEEREDGRESS